MTVTLAVAGDVATLRLDRPERGNALGPDMVAALDEGFAQAIAGGARLVVLRGAGRHFCTGFDLSDLDDLSEGDLLLRFVRIEALLQRVHGAGVTTLAVATGRTWGAGADLFAACDRRLAFADASFAFPGSGFGLVLGTARLAGRIGNEAARHLLLEGAAIDAATAIGLGLVDRQVDEATVDGAIAEAARAAGRLDAETVGALHRATRRDAQDDADLAALVRSAARPGLKQRIIDYRARARATRS